MSVAGILNQSGTIKSEYLPSAPEPHPYVESITAGAGIAVSGTATNPIITNTGSPVSFDAQTSLSVVKGDSNVVTTLGKVLRVLYTTDPGEPNNSWLNLPSPGNVNDTYGFLFSNVGGANADVVQVNYGPASPSPSVLFSASPSTNTNLVYWAVNIGPDSWVWFN